jgi:hypothetical protein
MLRPRCRARRPHAWREIQTAREVETAGADHLVELTADLAHTVLSTLRRIASDSAIQRRLPPFSRVEIRHGGFRSNISVSASFVWRYLGGSTMTPFSIALAQGSRPSPGRRATFYTPRCRSNNSGCAASAAGAPETSAFGGTAHRLDLLPAHPSRE